jgi:hypothetical protein
VYALAGLTALTHLDLRECNRVSDRGLLALAGLTALTCLDMQECNQVSDNRLHVLLAVLPRLDFDDVAR